MSGLNAPVVSCQDNGKLGAGDRQVRPEAAVLIALHDAVFHSPHSGGAVRLSNIGPRLFNWAKMDKTEENGTVYYVKPKLNDFALYEWVYLFLEGVVGLLLLINLFVTPSIPF